MSVDSQYLNSGSAQTTTTVTPARYRAFDATGAFVQNVVQIGVCSLTVSAMWIIRLVFGFAPPTRRSYPTLPAASNVRTSVHRCQHQYQHHVGRPIKSGYHQWRN